MNKEQAGHILDGYIRIFNNPNMDDTAGALREIILDAMTSYKTSYVSTYPSISIPTLTNSPSYPGTTVTCNGGGQ